MLKRYEHDRSYIDCYYMDLPRAISIDEYVSAFYTTTLFKVERCILALAAGRRSTDAGAQKLALGLVSDFAIWSVEDRAIHELLLRDVLGRTRSWLMVKLSGTSDSISTRLYFGSAVMPKSRPTTGKASFGFAFHALYGFHHMYTKALMRAARTKLLRATA